MTATAWERREGRGERQRVGIAEFFDMSTPKQQLSFERPIFEMEARLEALRGSANTTETRDEIQRLRLALAELTRSIYSNLTAWETTEVARHPERPQALDYFNLVFDEFVELHGDKVFGDDRTIRTGWARIDNFRVMVVKMKLAAKFGLPIICLIDTPGAYPGQDSEERGIAQAIAESMYEMTLLRTPIVCVVIGEGGSGGACGIGLGDRVAMLQYAYYSVISPEGCAGILWKDGACKDKAAEALKFTSGYLKRFGVVEDVIEEPLGGAHRDHRIMALNLKKYLVAKLRELTKIPTDRLVEERYARFRRFGVYLEEAVDAALENPDPKEVASSDANA